MVHTYDLVRQTIIIVEWIRKVKRRKENKWVNYFFFLHANIVFVTPGRKMTLFVLALGSCRKLHTREIVICSLDKQLTICASKSTSVLTILLLCSQIYFFFCPQTYFCFRKFTLLPPNLLFCPQFTSVLANLLFFCPQTYFCARKFTLLPPKFTSVPPNLLLCPQIHFCAPNFTSVLEKFPFFFVPTNWLLC